MMQKLDFNTVLLIAISLFFVLNQSCNTDKDDLIKFMENQNNNTLMKFDSLQTSINSLELEVIQKDTVINNYRNFYYEISGTIDSVNNIDVLVDSVRSKLYKLYPARFNED